MATVLILIFGMTVGAILTIIDRSQEQLYELALKAGYEHDYEKAISILRNLKTSYLNEESDEFDRSLHLWRFQYALLSGEDAFPINYQMEQEGWFDTSALMERDLMYRDIRDFGYAHYDIPDGWGGYTELVKEARNYYEKTGEPQGLFGH